MKTSLITGITGQDGSYLAEFLLNKGYSVHGLLRKTSFKNLPRIEHLKDKVVLHEGDLIDQINLEKIIKKVRPEEVYNLGAMSDVHTSFEIPDYTAFASGLSTLRLLNAIREYCPHARFYQASTSELFGMAQEIPQTEKTPFYPRSPYAIAKLYAYWTTINYRESYGIYACNGILFNHESPRRGENFVSRKITLAVAKIAAGLQKELVLGNLYAKRDWGYAKEFVEGMWLILQQPSPEDFILATGKTFSIKNFVELSFKHIGIILEWEGEGLSEIGKDHRGNILVRVSSEYYRPAEVDILLGNATKAQEKLGWVPKTSLEELVSIMIKSDIALIQKLSREELIKEEYSNYSSIRDNALT